MRVQAGGSLAQTASAGRRNSTTQDSSLARRGSLPAITAYQESHHDRVRRMSQDLGLELRIVHKPLKSFRANPTQIVREEVVSKLGSDESWLPRKLVLDQEFIWFLRADDDISAPERGDEGSTRENHSPMVVDKILLESVKSCHRVEEVLNATGAQSFKRSTHSRGEMLASGLHSVGMAMNASGHGQSSPATNTPDLRRLNSNPISSNFLSENSTREPQFIFEIVIAPESFVTTRHYFLRTTAEKSCNGWIADIMAAAVASRSRARKQQGMFLYLKGRAREVYRSVPMQLLIIALIIANFVFITLEAESDYEPGSRQDKMYDRADIAFTTLFAVEVCFNLFAHFFREFVKDGWNLFDLLIAVMSVLSISITTTDLPIVSHLRILRTFRLLRVFGRLKQLRRIVMSITASLPAVIQAFTIGLMVTFIYAVIGVEYFGDDAKESFGTFSRAVYTLFAVVAFQRWIDTAGELESFDDDGIRYGPVVYIYSFVMVVVWVLLQVVVAVLLENFFSATALDKEREAKDEAVRFRSLSSPLDPLLQVLSSQFDTSADLSRRIQRLFQFLDREMEKSISFRTLRAGLATLALPQQILLSREDFIRITNSEKLCREDGRLGPKEFENMIRIQLRASTQRKIADALAMDTSFEIDAILTGLKVILMHMDPTPTTVEDIDLDVPLAPAPHHPDNAENPFADVLNLFSSANDASLGEDRLLDSTPPQPRRSMDREHGGGGGGGGGGGEGTQPSTSHEVLAGQFVFSSSPLASSGNDMQEEGLAGLQAESRLRDGSTLKLPVGPPPTNQSGSPSAQSIDHRSLMRPPLLADPRRSDSFTHPRTPTSPAQPGSSAPQQWGAEALEGSVKAMRTEMTTMFRYMQTAMEEMKAIRKDVNSIMQQQAQQNQTAGAGGVNMDPLAAGRRKMFASGSYKIARPDSPGQADGGSGSASPAPGLAAGELIRF